MTNTLYLSFLGAHPGRTHSPRPQVQIINTSYYTLPNVYNVPEGYGLRRRAQCCDGRASAKVQLQVTQISTSGGRLDFLKVHAMDCIVWANSLALTPVDELPRPVAGTVSAEPFDEEEKRRIRNVTIDDSEDEADTELTLSQLESDEEMSEEDHGDSSYVEGWEKSLEDISKLREQQPRHSLKRRQLELIGAGVKKFREECDNRVEVAKTRFLEETKARWIASGMMKEVDADLLESVDGPYHPNIEKTRE
ncbi:hypothetical protein OS493_028345 [Desmophyllum pertusum]|uniref:Uncharacterized protein n=1 Tax=Desmophyllum pertusum TaxID=174260 RepID=A0A9X0CET4_9CNID|nr:hypothetical protein OS493_028345 [Desmophyllum pertusum]